MNKEIICPNCSQRIKILDTIGYDLYLENLKKEEREIKRLKEEYMILQNASDEVEEEKDREIERLNNIINELEKYCKEMAHIEENELIAMNDFEEVYIDVLDKIKELKGSDKE